MDHCKLPLRRCSHALVSSRPLHLAVPDFVDPRPRDRLVSLRYLNFYFPFFPPLPVFRRHDTQPAHKATAAYRNQRGGSALSLSLMVGSLPKGSGPALEDHQPQIMTLQPEHDAHMHQLLNKDGTNLHSSSHLSQRLYTDYKKGHSRTFLTRRYHSQ